MNELDIVFTPKGLTKDNLRQYSKDTLRRFYLRPRIVLNYMKRLTENPCSLPFYFRGLAAFLKEITS